MAGLHPALIIIVRRLLRVLDEGAQHQVETPAEEAGVIFGH